MLAVNLTALSTQVAPLWVDDPPGRGTWSLLYSCTFTLGLCVWTSIHLNVPPKESPWKSWRRKLKWLFIALFAPEVLVFVAFEQWLTAKVFLKELIKISNAKTSRHLEGGEASQSNWKFDIVYAQYVTMGGFAVQIGHLHNTVEQATLTPSGLLFLADQGHFFELSLGTIADKSKANLLAKGLVCLQVLWVAGQVIERKIAGYPISVLEFHTLVHVFCALVMYALWIRKPYDVNEPTVIPSGVAENALAFLVTTSQWRGHSGFFYPCGLRAIADPIFYYYGALETSPQVRPKQLGNGREEYTLENMDDPRINNHLMRAGVDTNRSVIEPGASYYAGEAIEGYYTPPNGLSAQLYLSSGQALRSGLGPEIQWRYFTDYPVGTSVGLSTKDLDRLNMAGTFINDVLSSTDENEESNNAPFAGKVFPTDYPFDPLDLKIFRKYGKRLISHRQQNMLNINVSDQD